MFVTFPTKDKLVAEVEAMGYDPDIVACPGRLDLSRVQPTGTGTLAGAGVLAAHHAHEGEGVRPSSHPDDACVIGHVVTPNLRQVLAGEQEGARTHHDGLQTALSSLRG